jgi:hypothetical protein
MAGPEMVQYQPQQTNALLRRQGRRQRKNIIGRHRLRHRLHSTSTIHCAKPADLCYPGLLPIGEATFTTLVII